MTIDSGFSAPTVPRFSSRFRCVADINRSLTPPAVTKTGVLVQVVFSLVDNLMPCPAAQAEMQYKQVTRKFGVTYWTGSATNLQLITRSPRAF